MNNTFWSDNPSRLTIYAFIQSRKRVFSEFWSNYVYLYGVNVENHENRILLGLKKSITKEWICNFATSHIITSISPNIWKFYKMKIVLVLNEMKNIFYYQCFFSRYNSVKEFKNVQLILIR